MKRILSLVTAVLISFGTAKASIDNVLDNMVTVHTSSPGVYKSPTMATGSLGSFSFRIRNDVLNLPLYTIRPPRATISCAGMDFDAGMIGMLNLDTLQSMLEQAGASFAWGIMIGLIYSLPGVADAFAKLNQWARFGQNLFSNACNVGISLGKTMGSGLFSSAATEAAEYNMASGVASTLSEAWKKIKTAIDKSKLYGDFPYSYFYQTGLISDSDLADALATFFGIIDFKPYDESGNPCNKEECLQPKNVKFIFYPPKVADLNVLLDGGTIVGYHCDWGLVNGVNACLKIEQNKLITVNKGLKARIKEKIDNIVNTLSGGGELTNDQIAFINYFDIANYIDILTVLKKRLSDETYQEYADALSSYLALLTIRSFIYSAEYQLSRATAVFASNKSVPADVANQMQKRIHKAKTTLEKLIRDYQDSVALLRKTELLYKNMKAEIDSQIAKTIGKPSILFSY